MRRLPPRRAFITGGTSGIGLAIARRLAADGGDVVTLSLDPRAQRDEALRVIADARRDPSQRVRAYELDVTDRAAVRELIRDVSKEIGAPEVLINSAGVGGALPFTEARPRDLERSLSVNLYGCWHTIEACLPHMGTGAHVVNVSSMAGLVGSYGYTVYASAKFAVVGFSQALRAELAPRGIAVSVLCPVQVDTPMLAKTDLTKPPETLALNAKSGVMSADDVARGLLEGMRKGRFLIIPGRRGRLIHALERWAPGLRMWLSDRVVRRVRAEGRVSLSPEGSGE